MMKIQGIIFLCMAWLVYAVGPRTGISAPLAAIPGVFGIVLFFEGLKRETILGVRKAIESADSETSCDEDLLRKLISLRNDIEAAEIVNALADHGIKATAVGGFTSGFKADAPGDVQVLVRVGDFEEAKLALSEIQSDDAPVDWDSVDVGEPEDE
jgi:hypothetical protein